MKSENMFAAHGQEQKKKQTNQAKPKQRKNEGNKEGRTGRAVNARALSLDTA